MEDIKRVKAEYRSSIRSKVMIREALLALMLEKPFDKITITDIVRKADINRGTFYAHFKNTNEVLSSISVSIVQEIGSALSSIDPGTILSDPVPFLEGISSFILKDLEFVEKLLKTDKFSDVLENARHASIQAVLEAVKDCSDEKKRMLIIILDYSFSGIMTLYIDIVLKRIPISMEDSAYYIARTLSPQVNAMRDFLNSSR
ncbi:MAG: TetR family transcriptional regulator [Spirochaetales bacterium]|nr:TetR family transcriptional regulator [Candidatus Physcosoma equi]